MLQQALISIYCVLTVLSQVKAGGVASGRRHDSTGNDVTSEEDAECARQMSRVYNDDVITPYPPDLVGEWTSIRCEVRPGPQFLLRKYQFFNDNRFSVLQFYYEDSYCKRPLYVLLATGSYDIVHPSWLLSGATDVDYQLNHVRIMPTTDKMAALLAHKVNTSCPNYVTADWRRNSWHDLFSYVEIPDKDYPEEDGVLLEDKDCLSAISFSLHELQLMRLELRKRHHGIEKRLLLGDIHTDAAERRTYRPTGFQEPLFFMDQVPNCPVCAVVTESDEYHPPLLRHHHQPAALQLSGSWFSVECETRPNGVFVTRHLSFDDRNKTWQGYYHHFLDGRCRRPQFTAHVRGKYSYRGRSRLIDDAHEIDFQVLESWIKPTDPGVVPSLNASPAGGRRGCGTRSWRLNEAQDVTPTAGCAALGIRLPHTEYEVVRIDRRHHTFLLYFGQRPTSGADFSPSGRPTSFQSPLVRCSDRLTSVTPSYGFHVLTVAKQLGGAASSHRLQPRLLTASLLLVISSFVVIK